jgi:hypothetical protein
MFCFSQAFVFLEYGSPQEIIPQDCAGFGLVSKAHPAAHIEIRVGGCNAVDRTKVSCKLWNYYLLGPCPSVEKGSANCTREQKALI